MRSEMCRAETEQGMFFELANFVYTHCSEMGLKTQNETLGDPLFRLFSKTQLTNNAHDDKYWNF